MIEPLVPAVREFTDPELEKLSLVLVNAYSCALDRLTDKTCKKTARDLDPAPLLDSKKRTITVRCSGVGSCRRLLWYSIHQPLEPGEGGAFPPGLAFNGHIFQTALEQPLADIPGLTIIALDNKRYTRRIRLGAWTIALTGQPDAVVEYKGVRGVIDFKSLSEKNIGEFNGRSDLLGHYLQQTNSYCYLTKSKFHAIYGRGKKMGEMRYALAQFNKSVLLKWLCSLPKNLTRPRIKPPRDYISTSFACTWCAYKQECWGVCFAGKSHDEATLPDKAREDISRLYREYIALCDQQKAIETSLNTVRAHIQAFHENHNTKRISIEGVGKSWVQTRERTFEILDDEAKEALEKWNKERENIKNALKEQGHLQQRTSRTVSLVVPKSGPA